MLLLQAASGLKIVKTSVGNKTSTMVATADVTIIGYNHFSYIPGLNCDWTKNKDGHACSITSMVISPLVLMLTFMA